MNSPDRPRGGGWGSVPREQLQRLLEAAAPVFRAAATQEATAAGRPGIAEAIDPAKLDLLADWFDQNDAEKGRTSFPEVQADLRRWAKLVRAERGEDHG